MIKLPIFMYHHISESYAHGSPKYMHISPDHFEQQMVFLDQKGFRCLSLADVVTRWQGGKPQPEHSFVLTFDDGYADIYKNCLPILKKIGGSATVFVVVKKVEEGENRFLSWQEIKELAQNNFTIGSHTMTHPRLRNLNSISIERELSDSKKIIEDRLGLPVDLLAYPYGETNELIQDIACKVGYHAACGVNEGHLTPFNLWRVPIKEHERELILYWKACGGYYASTWFRNQTYLGIIMRAIKRYIRRTRFSSIFQ
jgi:peptidoglycan/xylan/chitin deacetylase (PgdA/CDA1 family)